MALLIHIVIAVLSVTYSSYLFLSPSKEKLYVSYLLAGATLLTGTSLIFKSPSHMAQACVMGIAYLGFVVFSIAVAHKKLASSK